MYAEIIAIWGANGVGKTTTTVNLALALAERNFTVGVISSNLYYGEMQSMFGCTVTEDRGLYKALTTGDTKNMFTQAGKASVFIMSVPDEFDAMQLTTVSGVSVKNLLEDAAIRFDYLLIDCDTELNNPISSVGMAEADRIYTVHRPSVKDCLWYNSMRKMVDLLGIIYKNEPILNGHDKSCDLAEYKSSIGLTFDYEFDFVDEANIYANAGKPIMQHDTRRTKGYKDTMRKLASAIIA